MAARIRDATSPVLDVTEADLMSLEEELTRLVSAIGQQQDVGAAGPALTELDSMQTLLATIAFKYKVSLAPRLYHVVRQLDRLDDPAVRLAVHRACQTGQFWDLRVVP